MPVSGSASGAVPSQPSIFVWCIGCGTLSAVHFRVVHRVRYRRSRHFGATALPLGGDIRGPAPRRAHGREARGRLLPLGRRVHRARGRAGGERIVSGAGVKPAVYMATQDA
jgi:hypothetical protein